MEWVGMPVVYGSSRTVQYALITTAIAGLQFVWSIEQAYVNVYLLDLGMTKSGLSLMWLAGPMCGLVVQPVVGVISDLSTSPHGRRRPFMVWGSLCVAGGLVAFGWAREIGEHLGIEPVTVAVLSILFVDVAINTCQACCRALIVDMFSAKYQEEVNGWAGRMASLGHLASYYLGSVDLTRLGFGNQLKAAAVIYSLVLIVCVSVSATAVKERALIRSPASRKSLSGELAAMLSRLWNVTVSLDFELAAIFKVQLLAWYAWFTFLFYGSTYASEIWRSGRDNSTSPPTTGEMARAGSRALTVFSFSSTIFTFILPRLPVNIVRIWTVSFIVYAGAISITHWTTSYNTVLIIFGLVGFSWAATLWIPFALTSTRIHQLPNQPSNIPDDAEQQQQRRRQQRSRSHHGSQASIAESSSDSSSLPPVLHVLNDADVPDGHDEQSGLILGIHNSALTLPQLISSFGSYMIFQLLDVDPKNPHSDNGRAIAVTLQVGAVTALMAALYSNVIKKYGF